MEKPRSRIKITYDFTDRNGERFTGDYLSIFDDVSASLEDFAYDNFDLDLYEADLSKPCILTITRVPK